MRVEIDYMTEVVAVKTMSHTRKECAKVTGNNTNTPFPDAQKYPPLSYFDVDGNAFLCLCFTQLFFLDVTKSSDLAIAANSCC